MASTQVALSPKPPHLEAGPSSLRRVHFNGPNNHDHCTADDNDSVEKDRKLSFVSPKKMKDSSASSVHKSSGRKRSYSLTESKSPFKRRRKEEFVRPTKFLLGGNSRDPLNLGSLADETVNRALNERTPQSSPLPTPRYRKEEIEVLIPPNICDPLNLNAADDDDSTFVGQDAKKRKRQRNKRRPRTRSASEVLSRSVSQDLVEQLPDTQIPPHVPAIIQTSDLVQDKVDKNDKDVKVDKIDKVDKTDKPTPKTPKLELLKSSKKTEDKIVSPVVPQPGARKRVFQRSTSRDPHTKTAGTPQVNKKNRRFVYGNYNRYYGYRNPEREEDIRLRCFKPEWFQHKRVLDIGCNIGHVTLSVARDFCPTRIIGMDIDPSLIAVARKNIRHYTNTHPNPGTTFPICMSHFYGPLTLGAIPDANFPRNLEFIHGNYVLESDDLLQLERPEFDVILCLSVTKWVHLNWGDAGLKRFFRRMFLQLHPGGKLILEAQGWSSYSKRKKLTDTISRNFMAIQLYPEKFKDYLLNQVGFESCEVVAIPGHSAQGFRRPIHLYTKPLEPPPAGSSTATLVISASTTTSTTTTTSEYEKPQVSISETETVITQETTVVQMDLDASTNDNAAQYQDDTNQPLKDSG